MNEVDNWQEQVLAYWYSELSSKDWFVKNEVVDQAIAERFKGLHERLAHEARGGGYDTGHDALAAVIVLDQFPRNMYRGSPRSFASDAQALAISAAAIEDGLDKGLSIGERQFLYMPHMHSEDAAVQARCVRLFGSFNNDQLLDFAVRHKQIIDRFGRFPHRNEVLGRQSTPEELAFLQEPGSVF